MFKNNLKASAIALTALFLVGCTEITVSPADNDEVILNDLFSELEKNVNSTVYDALRDGGNITQRTLEDVMVLIAEDRLDLEKYTNDDLIDLKRYTEDDVTDPNVDPVLKRIHRRINVKMYDLIASGQFETRNLFSEERFAISIEKQLYELDRDPIDPWIENFIFPPRNTEDIETGKILDQAIHIEYYDDFILNNLIPKIYRELLVENYLIEKDYSSLGRSYARKVNYVALKVSTEYQEAVKYLMDEFIDQYILGGDVDEVADLELLARAWRGVDTSQEAEEDSDGSEFFFDENSAEFNLLNAAGLIGEGKYRTLYGEIVDRFKKIIPENPSLTDDSIKSEFTGNNQHTPEVGLAIRRNELSKRDFTTDGWHVKNGGLGSLPAAIRDRVFNIGVANEIDSLTSNEKFLRKINGVSYLIPETSQQNNNRNFLLYDSNTTTYYIVQVLEAVNTTKMNQFSSSNYDALEGDDGVKRAEIADEIARIIGVREASINASNLHWLKLADLKFHDQTIYDFFKERFPTLYDEDAE